MKPLLVFLALTAVSLAQTVPASNGNTPVQPNSGAMSAADARDTLTPNSRGYDRMVKEVRHELVLLPRYGVFDDLRYQVAPDGTITLMGYVADPTLKPDAERAVKHIEGVENVVNNIQVLPTSPNDDRIRRATYRAIYGNDVLSQYQLRAVPPIHIIVNNGHVILTGVVSRAMDKQVAEMQAKGVPGVFSVDDQLQVEND